MLLYCFIYPALRAGLIQHRLLFRCNFYMMGCELVQGTRDRTLFGDMFPKSRLLCGSTTSRVREWRHAETLPSHLKTEQCILICKIVWRCGLVNFFFRTWPPWKQFLWFSAFFSNARPLFICFYFSISLALSLSPGGGGGGGGGNCGWSRILYLFKLHTCSTTTTASTQWTDTVEVLLSYLFLLIQLTSFSETELLWQINNLKSHMHKMWITWGWKMTVEMRKR